MSVDQFCFAIVKDTRNRRRRKRLVNAYYVARDAFEDGRITIRHGGSVANAYRHPAVTDAVLAVPVEIDGRRWIAVYASELPANKVTFGGAAERCLPGARALFDERFGAERRQRAHEEVRRRAREDLQKVLENTSVFMGRNTLTLREASELEPKPLQEEVG